MITAGEDEAKLAGEDIYLKNQKFSIIQRLVSHV